MSINLTKGQKIDLTKTNPGLTNIVVGLGWDPVKSFFGFGANIDCDASALLLNSSGKLEETVYFRQLKSKNKSVVHTGDNLTGDGDGDDEQIKVDLEKIPPSIHRIVFVVNIYQARERRQDFGKVKNCFIRIFHAHNNQELIRYNLSENYQGKMTLITGELYRHEGEWKFNAIGEGTTEGSLTEVMNRYR